MFTDDLPLHDVMFSEVPLPHNMTHELLPDGLDDVSVLTECVLDTWYIVF